MNQGEKKKEALTIKRPDSAGVDIGSEVHYVAVPPDRAEETVRHFGCLTPDLHEMARWLKECRVKTVAMESTGVYWIPVAQVLEDHGLEVHLVDARHVKNVSGRKTDVKDCQWLQELHSYGLLGSAFRPTREMAPLRSYWRQRGSLVEGCSQQIHLIHKALEQMNLQLHKVLSDVTGVTGLKIIRAIVSGERDARKLSKLRNAMVKSDEETLVKALTGHWREEHLFALKQAVEMYDIYQGKVAECDREIERYMKTLGSPEGPEKGPSPGGAKRRKNEPHFDLKGELQRMTGVDLTRINGISALTAQTVITEQGFDMSRFPTEKHFTSHLGLCPNNQVTGGRVKRTRSRRVTSRAALALRVAAQSLHRSKTALGAYLRRMKAKLGMPKAITATARRLAVLIYRMLKYGQDYVDVGQVRYQEIYQMHVAENLKRQAKRLGYTLVVAGTGEVVS
ncbi:MAG TPA: IS110 family transposase [Puia sp.]|nr:IS110 family transposase [Puia sp.]